MTSPVPGKLQGTKYGARGSYWSCRKDAAGNGIHTRVDYPAPVGTQVVAARPGTAWWVNHGSAFGNHQLEVRCGDGTRDFYAHMTSRAVGNGTKVAAGQQVGRVGAEGNVTGPHLHFERHATETGGWSCTVVRDPAPSVKYTPPNQKGKESPVPDKNNVETARSRIKRAIRDLEKAPKDRTQVQKGLDDLKGVLKTLPEK
jgi:murein DD-endopeptidase MepM/ murein hydrolase activator NlpD